jgi:hypothetical protein
MNAILCIAARHLAISNPDDVTYSTAAAKHLSRALSLFYHNLSDIQTPVHVDAFIATSVLLQYEVWTNTDFLSREDGVVSFTPARDRFFALSSSLKQVFLDSIPFALGKPSIFLKYVAFCTRSALIGAAKVSHTTWARYQDYFSYHRPLSMELLDVPPQCVQGTDPAISNLHKDRALGTHVGSHEVEDGYVSTVTEICLLESFLSEERSTDASPLVPKLARYIFTFPVVCCGGFGSMVQQSDPHALLLLYHFYRSVRILLPADEFWWAHKRATLSETVLKEWLTKEISKQAGTCN